EEEEEESERGTEGGTEGGGVREELKEEEEELKEEEVRSTIVMPGCAAVNCTNSSKKGFLMKTFPRDPVRRKQWLIKTRRDNWIPTNTSCLCEVHFAPDMWEKPRVDGTRKLKIDAVPTIFSFSAPQKKRKSPNKRAPVSKESRMTMELGDVTAYYPSDQLSVSVVSEDNEFSISPSKSISSLSEDSVVISTQETETKENLIKKINLYESYTRRRRKDA
ncbi:hypothetical protein NQ315_006085, partial [Exocentrus adspersus]